MVLLFWSLCYLLEMSMMLTSTNATANTYYKLHEDMSFSERELALFT